MLTHDVESWYRAMVTQILPKGNICVFLFDLGSSITVQLPQLRQAGAELFVHPVIAVVEVSLLAGKTRIDWKWRRSGVFGWKR